MILDNNEVERIAGLAKLEFSDADKAELLSNMNKVLHLMEKLNEVNTDGIAPLVYLIEEENRWREDTIDASLKKSVLLANAPAKDSDYFKVPKVLNKQNIDDN